VLRHPAAEVPVVGRRVRGARLGVAQDGEDVPVQRHLWRVLRAPREQPAGRRGNHRPRVDVLDADRLPVARRQHLVAMLHEAAFSDRVVNRRPAAGQIHDLDDVRQGARLFGVGDVDCLLEARAGAGSPRHRDGLDAFDRVAAHGRHRVLDEALAGRRGRRAGGGGESGREGRDVDEKSCIHGRILCVCFR